MNNIYTRKPTHHKLTFKKAERIRTIYAKGRTTQRELAEKYNVSRAAISFVVTYRTWVA